MDALHRIVSKPQAKPWRTRQLTYSGEIHTDKNGFLMFSPGDVENPKEWSRGRRWFITLICIVLITNASMASSSPSGCLPSISEELHVSTEVAKLTVTLFLLGFCTGPCLWAPLSEFYGRKIVFTSTFVLYTAFTFLCAFANNIGALLVGRFLCGTLISGVLSNTPGVFADLWGPVERGKSMTLFSCALQMGPAIGPITSGFYQLKLNWRWNFYQLLWVAGFSLLLLPLVPETLPSRALLAKAKRIRRNKIPGFEQVQAPIEVEQRSLFNTLKIALCRPWRILVDPISLFITIYITVVYSLLYMLFTLYPIVFIQKRGWNAGVGELPLLGVMVGGVLSGIYIFWDSAKLRKKIAAGYQPCAEDALPIGMTGAVLLPISMFWMAWTGEYNAVPWIVPTLGGVVLSFAISTLFVAFLSYLSESYLMYAASAQAANQICRSAIAAAAPLYTEQMFNAMGVAGAGSLIGGIAILLMPIPFVFYKYGKRIRIKSKFAPTPEPLTENVIIEKERSPQAKKERMDTEVGPREEVEKQDPESEDSSSDDDKSVKDQRFEQSNSLEKAVD